MDAIEEREKPKSDLRWFPKEIRVYRDPSVEVEDPTMSVSLNERLSELGLKPLRTSKDGTAFLLVRDDTYHDPHKDAIWLHLCGTKIGQEIGWVMKTPPEQKVHAPAAARKAAKEKTFGGQLPLGGPFANVPLRERLPLGEKPRQRLGSRGPARRRSGIV